MASDDQRQMAADARKVLKQSYDRGVEAGKEIGWEAGLESAGRQALLELHVEVLEGAAKKCKDEPARTAFKEAASILRDLAERGPSGVETKTVQRKAG